MSKFAALYSSADFSTYLAVTSLALFFAETGSLPTCHKSPLKQQQKERQYYCNCGPVHDFSLL